jgi:hypothetical protein
MVLVSRTSGPRIPGGPDEPFRTASAAAATYEIVMKGRATERLLRPLLDDLAIEHHIDDGARPTGQVRDAAHPTASSLT